MGKVFKGIGIGLSEEVLRELDAFAASKGVSRAEAIRVSVRARGVISGVD